MPLELKLERMADMWREMNVLTKEEHEEMEVGWRPYCPDWEGLILVEQGGTYKTLVARRDGEMIGYLCWMIDFDLEAKGTLIVHQCAWYVRPGNFSVAARMFAWAKAEWRRLGVKFVYLHNAERGRGKSLGKFFEKKGAIHCSNTYVLPLRG